MNGLRRHGARIAITLLPVLLALLHAAGVWRLPLLVRLDQFIYDARLRATMPRTLDPHIVIVDIDRPSLQRFGQWPWSRDKLTRLTDELMGSLQAGGAGLVALNSWLYLGVGLMLPMAAALVMVPLASRST